MLYQIIVVKPGEQCDHLISVEHSMESAQHFKSVIETRCKVSVRIKEVAE